jgi:hypothetical protein
MRLTIQRLLRTVAQRFGPLLTVGLVLAGGAPVALALNPPPPPVIKSLEDAGGGHTEVTFNWPGAMKQPIKPAGRWGVGYDVYIEQTSELVSHFTTGPYDGPIYGYDKIVGVNMITVFAVHGGLDETRYCYKLRAYVGDGTDAGSVFSDQSKPKCIGTQKDLIVTPGEPLPPTGPPPPTKPDLSVTKVSGPSTVADGATAVYEIVLWNDGTPAKGTAQIQISALGPLTLDSMIQMPDGFTCDTNDFGVACVGSLGGLNDPMISRGATFKMQVRGNGTGKATVMGSANHDRALDEMTVDNNMKMLDVTVS